MAHGKKMSGQIFISYRREESRWLAGRLRDRLSARFDRKKIFMDIDAIALGDDFVKAIEKTVAECDVLIAVIGAHWLISKDEQDRRRIDNSEDFVRREISTALRREICVIPVLVDGASMPRSTDLPDDLKPLVRRMALQVTDTGFDDDCRRLVAAIEEVLEKAMADQREREKREWIQAERYEREEKERSKAERRQKRLQAERHELGEKERQEAGRIPTLQDRRLRLLARFSFVPFVLVLLSWLLPFAAGVFYEGEQVREVTGFELFLYIFNYNFYNRNQLFCSILLSSFLCLIFVLSSHFLKYRWKVIPEVVVSWLCFVLLATGILFPLEVPNTRIGAFLACTFAAIGAVMKTIIYRRKLLEI
jgi:hypothetical protein